MELKGIKVKNVSILEQKQDVYDINVEGVHHYILENGMVTHNTMELYGQDKMKGGEGLFYSSSTIAYLSKAKLKDNEMDDLDLGQSGLVVTAKMVKNRMAKPKKVKFEISFKSGCNRFVGLDYWCTGENFNAVGVAKGKMVEDKFVAGGNRWYVKHLGKHVASADIFSEQVFTKQVLDGLQPIIKDYFEYKSMTQLEEVNNKLLQAKFELNQDDEDFDIEALNSSNLFDMDDEDED